MAEDVEIAVIGPKLEELVVGAVPLIENFLHELLVIVQLKAQRLLVYLVSGITENAESHSLTLGPFAAFSSPLE